MLRLLGILSLGHLLFGGRHRTFRRGILLGALLGFLTADADRAAEFLRDVDSACVYHNASTRFTDGAEFGMGAEIGISTDKLHARGPMGLEELTTYKYVVTGDGTVRG